MNVHCPYCNQNFNLRREFVAEAVAEMEEKDLKYYGVECIHCRKLIKIPRKQMLHFAPPEEASSE